MTMKCPACGKENVESAKFCKKCGAYLAWAPTTAAQPSEFPATQMAPDFMEPDGDATVIRPAARPAARSLSAPVAVAVPDPLLEALADRTSPSASSSKSQVAAPLTEDTPVRSGKAGLIVGALVLVVLLAAALAYWFLGRESSPEPRRPAAVAPAAPTEPVAAPLAPPQSAPPPVPEPMPALPPAPLAQPVPEPAPAPAAAEPNAAPKPRPKPAATAKPAPVQAAPRPTAPPPAPTAPPAAAPVAPEPAPAVPAGPSGPAQACEGKSFFGKPACMNEQCGTPKFAKHAQCVELREQNRRREEQQQRN